MVWHSSTASQEKSTASQQKGCHPEAAIRLPEYPARRRADLYRRTAERSPPGFEEFLSNWRPDVVHFHALTLGAGIDHARALKRVGIPYIVTYHTPAQSCQRGTLMLFGEQQCDGRLDPRRCAACTLQGQGWPMSLARLAAASPLSWSMPEGAWLPRIALPSLLAQANASWHEFFSGAARIIACAPFCRDTLRDNGIAEKNITIMRQALPGEDRKRTLRLPLRDGGKSKLGFFGRFTHVKGPDLLVGSVLRLRQQGFQIEAELVGPIAAADRTWAAGVIQRGGAAVRYLGMLQGDALKTWLDGLDAVVLPSRWLETGPLTLLESWDRGVPVLGTNLGGMRDFFIANDCPEFGFAVNDVASIVAGVQRLIAWDSPAPEVTVPGAQGLGRGMEAVYRECQMRPARLEAVDG